MDLCPSFDLFCPPFSEWADVELDPGCGGTVSSRCNSPDQPVSHAPPCQKPAGPVITRQQKPLFGNSLVSTSRAARRERQHSSCRLVWAITGREKSAKGIFMIWALPGFAAQFIGEYEKEEKTRFCLSDIIKPIVVPSGSGLLSQTAVTSGLLSQSHRGL